MKDKPTRIKSKHTPGLAYSYHEVETNIEACKSNPKIANAFTVATGALEKHVQNYFRDFGAGQIPDQETVRPEEQITPV